MVFIMISILLKNIKGDPVSKDRTKQDKGQPSPPQQSNSHCFKKIYYTILNIFFLGPKVAPKMEIRTIALTLDPGMKGHTFYGQKLTFNSEACGAFVML